MDPRLDPIHFLAAGFAEYGDRVPVRAAAEALLAFAEALEAITRKLSSKDPAVSWVIQDAEIGSFGVDIEPQPETAAGLHIADTTFRLYALAAEASRRGADPEAYVPKRAAEAIIELQGYVDLGQLQTVYIRRGELEVSFLPAAAPQSDQRKRQSLGSIEGELTTVSFSGAPYFTVRTRLDNVSVRCSFDPDRLYDDVVGNLRRRVLVSGFVTKGPDGIPTSVSQVEQVYAFPRRDRLPQPRDIRGSDPGLIEGLPSEDWVRSQRG